MRCAAYTLIIFGLLLIGHSGYDEFRGVTRWGGRGYIHEQVIKKAKPEIFRIAMNYNWLFASMVFSFGAGMYLVDRRQAKSDPLSPDFAGNKALDDWSEALKKEEERRRIKTP